MIETIESHLNKYDYDIRKTKDARFMDQKVTPDVLSIIADCVFNYDADRNIEFTKDDIWNDNYFNVNVKNIFKKPDVQNETTKREYDKFISQPLRTLAYSKVLHMHKKGNKNIYQIYNRDLLNFIRIKERNAYIFLYFYLLKVLKNSGFICFFDDFKKKCKNGIIDNSDYKTLKERFQNFIIGNTKIKGKTEVNRIFPKVLNIYSCENHILGTIRGHLSKDQIYFHDLLYNRKNWRDKHKNKNISRNEHIEENKVPYNSAYSDYQVKKAMDFIRDMYKESEVKDQWANGEATQVHHIFSKSSFPELAHYLENLIKLTPTQHYTKAHPSNKTDTICKEYQLVCLLAKSDNIEKSINNGEFIYRKESFIYVINQGLDKNLNTELTFKQIKKDLCCHYNRL
jgi:hypothetical protein